MHKWEKAYGVLVFLVLFELAYTFVASGVMDGSNMTWGMFAFYSMLEVLFLLPCVFLLLRFAYRYAKGRVVLDTWVIVQAILYILACAFIVAASPEIFISFLIAFI